MVAWGLPWLMGSVLEQIARKASCGTFIVRLPKHYS
jgi:nucleotide-binding universal stress UspA family protein